MFRYLAVMFRAISRSLLMIGIFIFIIVCVLQCNGDCNAFAQPNVSKVPNQQERIMVSKAFLIKIQMELLERRRLASALRLVVEKQRKERAILLRYYEQRILAERAICFSRTCKPQKCDVRGYQIALGLCLPGLVGSFVGGFAVGKENK